VSQTTSLPLHGASAAFDCMADTYDATFTQSLIGRAQRNVVWRALQDTFRPGDRVLELNCGTGEDALFLAKRGVSVLACDSSTRMIAVAQQRKALEAPDSSLQFRVSRNEDIDVLTSVSHFDGVLSNFSGLNCVRNLPGVARKLTELVKPGAAAFVCLSSRVCLWEMTWYASRGNFRKAFRRLPGSTVARLNEITVPVWYPTIAAARRSFSPHFRLRSIRAVGLFVPPSYLESWARRHQSVLRRLEAMDAVFAAWPIVRGMGDHVLLEFEKTTELRRRSKRPALQSGCLPAR
jgi:ubiquinone/menaquinone biosynthesis C-methylase UbiE